MADNPKEIKTWQEYEEFVNTLKGRPILLNFSEKGNAKCEQVDEVVQELTSTMKAVHMASVRVEGLGIEKLTKLCNVHSLPTVLIMQNNEQQGKLVGVDPRQMKKMLETFVQQKSQLKASKDQLTERLKFLVNKEKVMVFLKGSADQPLCGFSKKLMAILKSKNIKYGWFDILKDEEVRQALKQYSNWPTYPQLYVHGQLLGGVDVVVEMEADGDLDEALGIQA